MDTRTGRIYTGEEAEILEKFFKETSTKGVDSSKFPKFFKNIPISERPTSMNDIKEMKIPPTEQQLKQRKVGRNDLCPCGSGKKFKKCCLNSENNTGKTND